MILQAVRTPQRRDDAQWLSYWIIASVLTTSEATLIRPTFSLLRLNWVWTLVQLPVYLWLVLPQFRGAAFIYEQYLNPIVSQVEQAPAVTKETTTQLCPGFDYSSLVYTKFACQ